MHTATDSRPDIVSVLSLNVEPRGQDPLGEIKYASLTLSGFVHKATITHEPESFEGFEFRVSIANERAALEEDTHLVKFQTGDPAGLGGWSVRRSKEEVKYSRGEWGPGVSVLALCLRLGETAAEFLVLGQCPGSATKLERIGLARFTTALASFEGFVGEVTRDCHKQTITLV